MNGSRKSKGIIIELTALLDVILIMLFWVMMDMQNNNDEVKADAEKRVEAAQSALEDERTQWQEQLDSILDDTSRQVAEAWEKAESVDSQASQNQQALDGYEQGLLVTLNLKYDDNGKGKLYISQGKNKSAQTDITSAAEISAEIEKYFEDMGSSKDDVLLCALVYDGDKALYRDVKEVTAAVDMVGEVYENFYCAYINTTNISE